MSRFKWMNHQEDCLKALSLVSLFRNFKSWKLPLLDRSGRKVHSTLWHRGMRTARLVAKAWNNFWRPYSSKIFSSQTNTTWQLFPSALAIISLCSAPDVLTSICLLEWGFPSLSYADTSFLLITLTDQHDLSILPLQVWEMIKNISLMQWEEMLQGSVFSSGFFGYQYIQQ